MASFHCDQLVGATVTGMVLVVVTLTKFTAGGWISMLFMAILSSCSWPSIATTSSWAASCDVDRCAGDYGVNHIVLVIRDLDAAAAEAVGVVRSIRPTELHILHPTTTRSQRTSRGGGASSR